MKILLIEDDPDLGKLLSEYLKMNGFDVFHAFDGKIGMEFLKQEQADLAIIDIMLPDVNGIEFSKLIKTEFTEMPFIFLTAKNRKDDIISGLKAGANDYITKPFEPEELILRINVALRSTRITAEKELKIGSSVLYGNEYKLKTLKREHKLTQRETELLSYLIENKNHLVKRETLLKSIWGENDYFMGRSMDVFISRLRKYFRDDNAVDLETYRGAGFMLKERIA